MSRPAPPPRHQAPSYWPRHRFAWQLHSKLISVFSKLLRSPASWWPKVHRADTIICFDRLHAQAASPRSRWTGWTTTGGAWVRSSGRPNWSPAPPTPTSPAICQTTHKVTQADSYTVGDMVHITEMFGGQSTWLGDRLLVCGGANWTSSHDQCHSWSPRYIQTLPAMLML